MIIIYRISDTKNSLLVMKIYLRMYRITKYTHILTSPGLSSVIQQSYEDLLRMQPPNKQIRKRFNIAQRVRAVIRVERDDLLEELQWNMLLLYSWMLIIKGYNNYLLGRFQQLYCQVTGTRTNFQTGVRTLNLGLR